MQHSPQTILLAQQQDRKLPSNSTKTFGAKERQDSLKGALLEKKLE